MPLGPAVVRPWMCSVTKRAATSTQHRPTRKQTNRTMNEKKQGRCRAAQGRVSFTAKHCSSNLAFEPCVEVVSVGTKLSRRHESSRLGRAIAAHPCGIPVHVKPQFARELIEDGTFMACQRDRCRCNRELRVGPRVSLRGFATPSKLGANVRWHIRCKTQHRFRKYAFRWN